MLHQVKGVQTNKRFPAGAGSEAYLVLLHRKASIKIGQQLCWSKVGLKDQKSQVGQEDQESQVGQEDQERAGKLGNPEKLSRSRRPDGPRTIEILRRIEAIGKLRVFGKLFEGLGLSEAWGLIETCSQIETFPTIMTLRKITSISEPYRVSWLFRPPTLYGGSRVQDSSENSFAESEALWRIKEFIKSRRMVINQSARLLSLASRTESTAAIFLKRLLEGPNWFVKTPGRTGSG